MGLRELCHDLHRKLRDQPWDDDLRSYVFTHESLFEVAKRRALRYCWIEPSLDADQVAWAVLAEGLLNCKSPPREEFCVGDLITMLKRWFLRLPSSWLKRDQEKLRRLFESQGIGDKLEGFTDQVLAEVRQYEDEFLRAEVFGWIREFEQPLQTIAMFRYEQELTYEVIAKHVGLSVATVWSKAQDAKAILARRISAWREE